MQTILIHLGQIHFYAFIEIIALTLICIVLGLMNLYSVNSNLSEFIRNKQYKIEQYITKFDNDSAATIKFSYTDQLNEYYTDTAEKQTKSSFYISAASELAIRQLYQVMN